MKLPEDFETFYGKITLGQTQTDRITSAATSLTDFLAGEFGLSKEDIFLQGSFPNGTAIKPDPEKDDGEYDVDLVAVCASQDDTPEGALDELERVLAGHGTYREMLDRDPNRPCVRLRYADEEIGGFHVDVVPARHAVASSAPLEIPRPGAGWRETAPREYTQWCRSQGLEFARAVQMLKRWRDHNQTAREAIKSIVLQVLISRQLPAVNNDAERVAGTLRSISDLLEQHPDSPPEITNPVLPAEVLSDRWEPSAYRNFRRIVAEAADLAEKALADDDLNRSRERWQELFGKDFPGPQKGGGRFTPPPVPADRRERPQRAPRVEWG